MPVVTPAPSLATDGHRLVRPLRIGQQCLVRCPSGQRLCRAALFMESKDKRWMALPAILCHGDGAENVMQHSYCMCPASQTEIGPCLHQVTTNGGNLTLVELDGELPKEAIHNYLKFDGVVRVPRVLKPYRDPRSLLINVKDFMIHTDDALIRMKVRDDAFYFTDKQRRIEKCVAFPLTTSNYSDLTHTDAGALVTTGPVGGDPIALGIFDSILEVHNKGVCCLVAPLWPSIEAISRQYFQEHGLRVMMPVIQEVASRVDVLDVLESLKNLFRDDDDDSAYETGQAAEQV